MIASGLKNREESEANDARDNDCQWGDFFDTDDTDLLEATTSRPFEEDTTLYKEIRTKHRR